MRIFLFELKKIFSPLRTLFILLFIVLFLAAFVAGSFSWSKNRADLRLSCDLKTVYGSELDKTERKEAEQKIQAKYYTILSESLKNDEWFLKNSVMNYEEITRLYEKKDIFNMKAAGLSSKDIAANGHKDYNPLLDYTLTDYENKALERFEVTKRLDRNMGSAYYTIDFSRYFFKEYDLLHGDPDAKESQFLCLTNNSSAAVTERYREIFTGNELNGLMPLQTANDVCRTLPYVAVLMVLSLFALLSPVITTDNMTGVKLLQHSSKTGKKTLIKSQYAAYLAAAFLTVTLEIVLYAALFFTSAEGNFKDCFLNSFLVMEQYAVFWYRGTLGGYLLCLAGIVYILATATTSIAFIVSFKGKNNISMLLKAIPAAAAFAVFAYGCLNYAFATEDYLTLNFSFSQLVPVKYIEVCAAVLLLVLSVAAAAIILKKNRSKELL